MIGPSARPQHSTRPSPGIGGSQTPGWPPWLRMAILRGLQLTAPRCLPRRSLTASPPTLASGGTGGSAAAQHAALHTSAWCVRRPPTLPQHAPCCSPFQRLAELLPLRELMGPSSNGPGLRDRPVIASKLFMAQRHIVWDIALADWPCLLICNPFVTIAIGCPSDSVLSCSSCYCDLLC